MGYVEIIPKKNIITYMNTYTVTIILKKKKERKLSPKPCAFLIREESCLEGARFSMGTI